MRIGHVIVPAPDLEAAVAELERAGASPGEPVTGPHERRVVVTDPAGNPVVVYQRLT